MRDPSPRKTAILAGSEQNAASRERFWQRAEFFHEEDLRYLRFLIPEGLKILELGCGIGNTLAGLKPSLGLGVDFSPAMIAQARRIHPDLQFEVGDVEDPEFITSLPGPFDVILIVDTLGSLDDCQGMFEALHGLCSRETRVIVVYYSHLWDPLLGLAEWVGLRAKQPEQNVLSPADIYALASLSDLEVIKAESRLLSPLRLFGIGSLINRFISILPLIRQLSLRHYSVCRSLRRTQDKVRNASVIIPARNEKGNIEAAIKRMPSGWRRSTATWTSKRCPSPGKVRLTPCLQALRRRGVTC